MNPTTCYQINITYWYHPDYLGSIEWVTNADGRPMEYFWYSPWGETLQADNSWRGRFSSPFKFTGHIEDEETGLTYAGARYYPARESQWLSVDPLAEKYPSLTPYNYVANNPVNLIDPDGRKWEDSQDEKIANKMIDQNKERITQMENELNEINEELQGDNLSRERNRELQEKKGVLLDGIQDLEEGIKELIEMGDDETVIFHFRPNIEGDGNIEVFRENKNSSEIARIVINYKMGEDGQRAHEAKHAYDVWKNPFEDITPIWLKGSKKSKMLNFKGTGTGSSQYLFEYYGYKRQYHFNPDISPLNFRQLNEVEIKKLNPKVYKW